MIKLVAAQTSLRALSAGSTLSAGSLRSREGSERAQELRKRAFASLGSASIHAAGFRLCTCIRRREVIAYVLGLLCASERAESVRQ